LLCIEAEGEMRVGAVAEARVTDGEARTREMESGVEREAGESRDAAGVPAEVVLVGGEGILFPGFAGLS